MPLSTKLWLVATVDKFINSRRQHFPLPAQFLQVAAAVWRHHSSDVGVWGQRQVLQRRTSISQPGRNLFGRRVDVRRRQKRRFGLPSTIDGSFGQIYRQLVRLWLRFWTLFRNDLEAFEQFRAVREIADWLCMRLAGFRYSSVTPKSILPWLGTRPPGLPAAARYASAARNVKQPLANLRIEALRQFSGIPIATGASPPPGMT